MAKRPAGRQRFTTLTELESWEGRRISLEPSWFSLEVETQRTGFLAKLFSVSPQENIRSSPSEQIFARRSRHVHK